MVDGNDGIYVNRAVGRRPRRRDGVARTASCAGRLEVGGAYSSEFGIAKKS